jgi:hypothetical protein
MNMKNILYTVFVFLFITISGVSGQKDRKVPNAGSDAVPADSVKYELLIFDPGFEAWLASKPSMNYYSRSFYESRNMLYVMEWNNRYLNPPRNGPVYETLIDYSPKIDYGLDLNYRLYYYFRYFEETNHVKLLNTVR